MIVMTSTIRQIEVYEPTLHIYLQRVMEVKVEGKIRTFHLRASHLNIPYMYFELAAMLKSFN